MGSPVVRRAAPLAGHPTATATEPRRSAEYVLQFGSVRHARQLPRLDMDLMTALVSWSEEFAIMGAPEAELLLLIGKLEPRHDWSKAAGDANLASARHPTTAFHAWDRP